MARRATMEKRNYWPATAALSVAVMLSCAFTGTAQAQFDILKSAKEAIGSFGGSTRGAGALTDAEIGVQTVVATRRSRADVRFSAVVARERFL